MPFTRPRTVSEALKAKPHQHRWKDWKDGIRFCVRCGFPITKASAESSTDCYHAWSQTLGRGAVCVKCGYEARGDDYAKWFRKYAKWPEQYRPKCMVCREPVMREGSICDLCSRSNLIANAGAF